MNADDLQAALAALIASMRTALRSELSSIWLPAQFGAIAVAAIVGLAVGAIIRRRFDLVSATMGWPGHLRMAIRALTENFGVLAFIFVIGVIRAGIEAWAPHPRTYLIGVAINLATAWVAIAILASLIRNHLINRVVAVTAWTIAALSIVGLLDGTVEMLDARAIVIGGLRVSPLLVLKTAAFLLVALWAAIAFSNFLARQVQEWPGLTPSIRPLIGTLIRITVLTVAIVVVLGSVGIDLSVLAVFTGAIGVGIGFGLQKIVANLVSGIILLADKSIKPGDVITVGETFGWVDTMGARYTSVVSRDGREFLIPNEDFVTQRVVNWSYSNNRVRLDVNFGVSYDSDPHQVQKLAIEAARSFGRVLRVPEPVCHLTGFGESSLDFILRFWIDDPVDGITNVRGVIMMALWDTFKREGIQIPYPVRDLRFGSEARVHLDRAS
jgi:small-conductance mechanosensitive channel